MKKLYIVRSVKSSSQYKIFEKRIDAIRFILKHPEYVLE